MDIIGPSISSSDHRERLLAGLAASIREKGLVATQITDIVRHAHASRRTFYNAFADKESCFIELAREATDAILGQLRQAVDPARPWQENVDTLIDLYFQILAHDPAMTVALSAELTSLGAQGQEARLEGLERYAVFLRELADSLENMPPVSEAGAVLVIGGIGEVVTYAVHHDRPVQEFADDIKRVVKGTLSSSLR